eukprot:4686790-Prymnesium_polylepis.1
MCVRARHHRDHHALGLPVQQRAGQGQDQPDRAAGRSQRRAAADRLHPLHLPAQSCQGQAGSADWRQGL